jgi:hypothetical protein
MALGVLGQALDHVWVAHHRSPHDGLEIDPALQRSLCARDHSPPVGDQRRLRLVGDLSGEFVCPLQRLPGRNELLYQPICSAVLRRSRRRC